MPFHCYCVLAPPAAAPPSSLVPLPLGNWYSATACRSRAQGSRKDPRSGSSPKAYVDVDHCAHCSFYVCSAVTSSGLNTTDRSRTTSVSQDKFVPPSLDIDRSHSCSTSRRSSRSSKPSPPHNCAAYTCIALSSLLLPLLARPLARPALGPTRSVYLCLALCLPGHLYLRKHGSTSRLSALASHSILYFAPRLVHLAIPLGPDLAGSTFLAGPIYLLPLTHTRSHARTHTHTSARAVHMVPCFPPPALARSGSHSDLYLFVLTFSGLFV